AVGADADRRDAAEVRIGRGEFQSAAEDERTEAYTRGIARLERRDRPGADLDPDRRLGGGGTSFGKGGEQGKREQERCESRARSSWWQSLCAATSRVRESAAHLMQP